MTRDKTSVWVAASLKYDLMLAIFLNSRQQLFLRCETALSIGRLFSKHIPRFFTFGEKSIMLLPIFNELGRTDLSLTFVPKRRISVFSLFVLCLFADIHKFMSSVDVEILSSNESI